MTIKCVIDIGSNTIKLFIADILEDKIIPLEVKRRMAQLGKGLSHSEYLNQESKTLAMKHITEYLEECKNFNIDPENILVTATAACRNARDGRDFIDNIKNKFNFHHVKILSGAEEAKFSFLGSISSINSINNNAYCILDVGGGSFQLSLGTRTDYFFGISVQTGANKVAELFHLKQKVTAEEVNNVIKHFENLDIDAFQMPDKPIKLVGIGGTIKVIQLMTKDIDDYNPLKLNILLDTAYLLANKNIEERFNWFVNKFPDDSFRNDCGLTINRAEVILSGLCIVIGIIKKFKAKEIMLSKSDAKDYIIRLPGFLD